MCNSQYVMRLPHHDVGSVQLDARYVVGRDSSDTKVH